MKRLIAFVLVISICIGMVPGIAVASDLAELSESNTELQPETTGTIIDSSGVFYEEDMELLLSEEPLISQETADTETPDSSEAPSAADEDGIVLTEESSGAVETLFDLRCAYEYYLTLDSEAAEQYLATLPEEQRSVLTDYIGVMEEIALAEAEAQKELALAGTEPAEFAENEEVSVMTVAGLQLNADSGESDLYISYRSPDATIKNGGATLYLYAWHRNAGSSDNINYQWKKRLKDDSSDNWINIDGAVSNELTFSGITLDTESEYTAWEYACLVSSGEESILVSEMYILEEPEFYYSYLQEAVVNNGEATFEMNATSKYGETIKYQWQRGTTIPDYNYEHNFWNEAVAWEDIEGADESSLKITEINSENIDVFCSYRYRCMMTFDNEEYYSTDSQLVKCAILKKGWSYSQDTKSFPVYYVIFEDGLMIIYCTGSSYSLYNIGADIVTRVVIGSGTTVVDGFYNHTNIESVELSESCVTIGDSAFYGCKNLKTVSNTEHVKEIGVAAFSNCDNLVSLGALSNLESIGRCAFMYCTSLQSLDSLDQLTVIDDHAFYNCTSLKSLETASSIISIGQSSFNGCKELETIGELPNLVSIGDFAFDNCACLKSLGDMPALITIGEAAFWGCTSITSFCDLSNITAIADFTFTDCENLVSIGSLVNVTSIGKNAFSSCSSLSSLGDLPNLTLIGKDAFYGCSSLTSFGDLEKVTEIGDFAFRYCTNLKSIGNLTSLQKIGDIFLNCTSLESLGDLDSCKEIYEYAFSTCSALSSIGNLSGVTELKSSVFRYNENLTSIGDLSSLTELVDSVFSSCAKLKTIGDLSNITTIGNDTFKNCENLTAINTSSKLTEIGDNAFYNCSKLAYIGDLSNLTTIGNYAFGGCNNLTTVNISSKLTIIGDSTFSGCTNLKTVGDLSNITTIGDSAFSRCESLTPVNIPNVTTIGSHAFYGCENLTSLGNSTNLSVIGSRAFGNCTSLVSLNGLNNIVSIDDYTFSGCTELVAINGLQKVIEIGDYAFSECTSLTSLNGIENVIKIGSGAFSGCTSIAYISDLKKIESIGGYAFNNCGKLSSVTLSDNLTTIGSCAFRCSGLTGVTIPGGIETVDWDWFDDCTRLRYVIFKSGVQHMTSYTSTANNSLKTLYIPKTINNIQLYSDHSISKGITYYYEGTKSEWFSIPLSEDYTVIKTIPKYNSVTEKYEYSYVYENVFFNCSESSFSKVKYGNETDILTGDYFPDANFLSALKNQFPSGLTITTAESLTSLNISGYGIEDLTGIQIFSALSSLNCANNCLTEISIAYLSSLPLTYLNISGNGLSALNISSMTGLKTLVCSNNKLPYLDVPQNVLSEGSNYSPQSITIECSGNASRIIVDMTDVVGYGKRSSITSVSTGTYDRSTGKVVLPSGLTSFSYTYDTGYGIMTVDANLNVSEEKSVDFALYSSSDCRNQVSSLIYTSGSISFDGLDGSLEAKMYIRVTAQNDDPKALIKAFHLTIKLPEGFSFEPYQLVSEKEVIISANQNSTGSETMEVYPIYMSTYAEKVTFSVTGDEELSIDIPVELNEKDGLIYCRPTKGESINSKYIDEPIPVTTNVNYVSDLTSASVHTINDRVNELCCALSQAVYEDLYVKTSYVNIGCYKGEFHETDPLDVHHVGYMFGEKKVIEDGQVKSLIFVTVRGTLDKEWIGNFNLNFNTYAAQTHDDFNNCKEELLTSFYTYVDKIVESGASKDQIKVLFNGHSRAGAVVNLAVHELNRNSDYGISTVAYTYAAPNSTREESAETDTNIFNIIYSHDVVAYVPQGYHKYGINIVIGPSAGASRTNPATCPSAVYSYFTQFSGYDYSAMIPYSPLLIGTLVSIPYVLENATVSAYKNTIGLVFSMMKSSMGDFARAHGAENYLAWVYGNGTNDVKTYESMVEAYREEFDNRTNHIMDFLDHLPNSLRREIIRTAGRSALIGIAALGAIELGIRTGLYIVGIHCPVNVSVCDSSNNTLISIVDHQVSYTDESSISYAVFDDIVYLFYDESLNGNIRISGYDTGTMTMSAMQFDAECKLSDHALFVDLPVSTDTNYNYVIDSTISAGNTFLTDDDGNRYEANEGETDPVFGEPDFILPAALTKIEESAFEEIKAAVIYVPDSCVSIGAYAFRCASVEKIRIPAGCTIADTAFADCGVIQVFGKAGSLAETFCNTHDNCTFIEEAE